MRNNTRSRYPNQTMNNHNNHRFAWVWRWRDSLGTEVHRSRSVRLRKVSEQTTLRCVMRFRRHFKEHSHFSLEPWHDWNSNCHRKGNCNLIYHDTYSIINSRNFSFGSPSCDNSLYLLDFFHNAYWVYNQIDHHTTEPHSHVEEFIRLWSRS